MGRPNLYILAGVNGAGKSSVGGHVLSMLGLPWYNPDTFARVLVAECGMSQQEANIEAWTEGMVQLDEAVRTRTPFAFETTLGGTTVCEKIKAAAQTHNIRIWYCGLQSPEMHLARVQLRVSQGGHDIPKEKILERWQTSRANLIALLPFLTELSLFDNSAEVAVKQAIKNPIKIVHLRDGKLLHPKTTAELTQTPDWAQAIVEEVLDLVSRQQRTA